MKTEELTSWEQFIRFLASYSQMSRVRRKQFIFRGHADTNWPLLTTLDRQSSFQTIEQRLQTIGELLREFRKETQGLDSTRDLPEDELGWELLGRHHGLPTPILDWSESPYIAAFFAFDGAVNAQTKQVAVWMLDRFELEGEDHPEIAIIDDSDAIRFNRRAIEQKAIFLRVLEADPPLETTLGNALTKIVLPRQARGTALADLDEMTINAPNLFRDWDGVARLVARRILDS